MRARRCLYAYVCVCVYAYVYFGHSLERLSCPFRWRPLLRRGFVLIATKTGHHLDCFMIFTFPDKCFPTLSVCVCAVACVCIVWRKRTSNFPRRLSHFKLFAAQKSQTHTDTEKMYANSRVRRTSAPEQHPSVSDKTAAAAVAEQQQQLWEHTATERKRAERAGVRAKT